MEAQDSALVKSRHKNEAPGKQGELIQRQPIILQASLEFFAKFLTIIYQEVLYILGLWKGPKNVA